MSADVINLAMSGLSLARSACAMIHSSPFYWLNRHLAAWRLRILLQFELLRHLSGVCARN